MTPTLVVLNRASRRGRAWSSQIESALGSLAASVVYPEDEASFQAVLHQAVDQRSPCVWVGGGDGTIRHAAGALVHSDVCLGILPMGTGNAIAGELGIPAHPARMVPFLRDVARPRRVDVGQFNDEVFVNVATLGVTSRIARALQGSAKPTYGRLVYVPALLRAVYLARAVTTKIASPDGGFRGRVLQLVAASTRLHAGPFAVTPQASMHDGLLSVYAVMSSERAALWRYGWALLRGKHTELPDVWSIDTPELRVALKRPSTFVLDGEPVRARSAKIRVLPGALNVLAAP